MPAIAETPTGTPGRVGPAFTVCANAEDALGRLAASPAYWAVIEWIPAASVASVHDACPPTRATSTHMVDTPSRNETWPVGNVPDTVAVNVTDCPKLAGFRLLETLVVVDTLSGITATTSPTLGMAFTSIVRTCGPGFSPDAATDCQVVAEKGTLALPGSQLDWPLSIRRSWTSG